MNPTAPFEPRYMTDLRNAGDEDVAETQRCAGAHRRAARRSSYSSSLISPRAWRSARISCARSGERGSQADYRLAEVSDEEARRAVDDAEAVVDIIDAWLQAER
jgi:hypothetical protein